jgi:hypothetical protein
MGRVLEDNHARVVALIRSGKTAIAIAGEMGCAVTAVAKFAKRNDLKITPAAQYIRTAGPTAHRLQRRQTQSTERTCAKAPVPAPKKYQTAADKLRDYHTIVFNASVYTGRREDAAYWYVNERRVHQSELLEMASAGQQRRAAE